jgi:hypothetical protein
VGSSLGARAEKGEMMTLQEVFAKAKSDGFTHAGDLYSYRGRKITQWVSEIESDLRNYHYENGLAQQTNLYPSNEYRFWKETKK